MDWNDLQRLAPSMSTPCYVYDLKKLRSAVASFRACFGSEDKLLYATMANPRTTIVSEVVGGGFGVFVNSLSHLAVATETQPTPGMISFAASGLSSDALQQVASSAATFCADSLAQLDSYLRFRPSGLLGIRINVGWLLGDDSDPAPRLGLAGNEVREARASSRQLEILHVYLGTNLLTEDMYLSAISGLSDLALDLGGISHIDVGGGLAIAPNSEGGRLLCQRVANAWQQTKAFQEHIKLILEPGRAVVKESGSLFVTVTDTKIRGGHQFITVDTSGTWYPRTMIHGATDHWVNVAGASSRGPREVLPSSICGCTTYSKDFLAHLGLPRVWPGTVLEFSSAGAYCESMHLDFLGVGRPSCWFVDEGVVYAVDD